MINKSEYDKMLAGELYDASDNELVQMRKKARVWMEEYNNSAYDRQQREMMLKNLFGKIGRNIDIQTPFYVDYGCHIEVGDNFFANFNCVFLDCNYIKTGDNVFLGPNVQLYAAHHPVIAAERIKGPELASPIIIADNVWIGGGSIVCAGVTIGANTTIGAGSVVVKDIPANVLAVGNPCRVVRNL
ncbi:sugar O-acetyltransferase [Panacibacter ginsenosidivorans]|uniref:Acetyltransferase n=1 Tax=Panacibacter ginsenosidivorans TaxID=1813871 RepID=A0A5B8V6Q5_9BACT|nr:sugar O-acetyltransferase [Panacibacter ginsenosidivorans]QEC66573.1 sugar O-acetyltransferase [Panacibacter ginsenosidivorans]